jgi:DNA-binding FrmR family transcriptional regulator
MKKDLREQIGELRQETVAGFQRVENRLLIIAGEIRGLHAMTGESRGKIDILEKQMLRK